MTENLLWTISDEGIPVFINSFLIENGEVKGALNEAISGLCLKSIAYFAQSQIRKKVSILHDMLNGNDRIGSAYLFAILSMLAFFILLFAMLKSC